MAWPTSERFRDLIGRSHFSVAKAEILEQEEVIAELTEPSVLFAGSVEVSRSDVQRRASVSIADHRGLLTPKEIDDLLMPAGRQMRLWRGVRFPNPSEIDVDLGLDRELVPLGTFRYVVADVSGPAVNLGEMYDRSWIIQGAKFENVYTIASGTQYDEAIIAILTEAYPDLPIDFPDVDETTAKMVFEAETDPWEVVTQLAANLDMRIYMDPMGVCVMQPEAELGRDPIVWTFDNDNEMNMALNDLAVTWSGQACNVVVVVAENSELTKPLRSVARDIDPLSPTKYGGLYGKRVLFVRDEKIRKQSQADSRARKELKAQVGITQSVEIPSLVIPQLEVDDIIWARDTRRLIGAKFVADSITVPLRGTDPMKLSLRARQVTTLEYDPTEPGVGLLIDASSPALVTQAVDTTTTLATASFTPPANSLLLVMWIGNEQSAVDITDPSITDSLGPLSWTRERYAHWSDPYHIAGQVGIWWAFVGGSPAAMTVTVTNNAASGKREAAMMVYVITGADAADPIGNSDSGYYESATTFDEAPNATRTGSRFFAAVCDPDATVDPTITPGSGVTNDGDNIINADMSYTFIRRTTADGVGGSVTHLNFTGLVNTHFPTFSFVEVRPAVA